MLYLKWPSMNPLNFVKLTQESVYYVIIFFRFSYMQLDLSAKSNVNSLGMNITNKKPITGSKQREEIVNFLIYVRNFTQR